jgi:hypothetical protein
MYLATDETFIPNIEAPCTTPLETVDICISITLIIRLSVALLAWRDWLLIRRRRLQTSTQPPNRARRRNRFPVLPLLNSGIALLWVLVFLLSRFNVINSGNGVVLLLLSLIFDGYAIVSFFFQQKIVKLGKKLIPIAKLRLHESDSSTSAANTFDNTLDRLSEFDVRLKFIVFFEAISILLQTISGCILGLIYPGEFTWFQVMIASQAVYVFFVSAAIAHQLSRVILCIKSSTIESTQKTKAAQKLHSRQIHAISVACLFVVVHMLMVFGIFPSKWSLLVYTCLMETTTSSLLIIEAFGMIVSCRCFRKTASNDKPGTALKVDPFRPASADSKDKNELKDKDTEENLSHTGDTRANSTFIPSST